MIDTDKYEGHTEGDWTWMGEEVFVDEGSTIARITSDNRVDANLIADAPLILEAYKQLRKELDTIKSHRSFEHRFSPTGYGMANEAWIGLTESGNGLWNDDKRSAFDDLRLLTEEEWWQWQEEDIDWPWNYDEIVDALDDAHHAYLRKCVDILEIEGGIMVLKKKLSLPIRQRGSFLALQEREEE